VTPGSGSAFDDRNVGDEAVPAPSDGFDKSRARRRITQRLSNPVNGLVHAVIEIDEGLGSPQPVAKLFPSDDLTRPLEQHRENLKRLFRQTELHAVLFQLAGTKIHLEYAETEADRTADLCHEWPTRVYHSVPKRRGEARATLSS
jgi:hypothetical protein